MEDSLRCSLLQTADGDTTTPRPPAEHAIPSFLESTLNAMETNHENGEFNLQDIFNF